MRVPARDMPGARKPDQFDMFAELPAPEPVEVTPVAMVVVEKPVEIPVTIPAELVPEPVVEEEPPAPLNVVSIRPSILGHPAVKKGYIGKYQGVWMHLLLSARAFEALKPEDKKAMQARLRGYLEAAVAARSTLNQEPAN